LLIVDTSRLITEGGLPDIECLDDPRVGGGAGSDTAEGDDNGKWCEEPRVDTGRLDGGGGGALPLSERGLPDVSIAAILTLSSSTLGDNLPELLLLRVNFESDTSWLCLRARGGAGGVFFRIDDDGDGGSGVFPAASLSNTDSRSESWLALFGAGGRGLLRSV
jgi:hypothetical protein